VLVWTGTVASAGRFPTPAQEPVRAHRPTRPHIWPRKSSPPKLPSKANASKSRCSSPISKARWSCWLTATPRRPASSSTLRLAEGWVAGHPPGPGARQGAARARRGL
jgi:hypothetical protein